jgi:hypothetical protein
MFNTLRGIKAPQLYARCVQLCFYKRGYSAEVENFGYYVGEVLLYKVATTTC